MRRIALLAMLVLTATALAGCSNGSAPPDACAVPPCVDVDEDKGALVGIVVDGAIMPVEDAVVALAGQDLSVRTDENGRFVLDDLEPGPYFVAVSKPGYRSVQQSAEVRAGTATDTLKVLLEADPEQRPYVEAYKFDGFIECGAGLVLNATTNPCFLSPNSVNVFVQDLDSAPTFVQAEMMWEESSVLGSGLQYSFFVPDGSGDGADDYAVASGASPLLLQVDEALGTYGIGPEAPLQVRVFPAGQQPTVHANQAFEVFVHVFYNYLPPADWRFSEDPDVPGPA